MITIELSNGQTIDLAEVHSDGARQYSDLESLSRDLDRAVGYITIVDSIGHTHVVSRAHIVRATED